MKATGADTTKQTASGWDYLFSGAKGGGGWSVGWMGGLRLWAGSFAFYCRCSLIAVAPRPLRHCCLCAGIKTLLGHDYDGTHTSISTCA